MKITGFQVQCVSVPLEPPHRTASGVIAASPLVLLTVLTNEGVQGCSMTFTYTPVALRPTADLLAGLEQLVVGLPVEPAAISQLLAARFRLLGTQGLTGMALSAIDMALWDAVARSQSKPLHALLGASATPIRCYGGVGYDGELESARVAEQWAKQGFLGVKAKIGYPTVAEDVAVIRAMRAAVGPDVAVMVDYNQSLSHAEARTRLRALAGEGLLWVEEPVAAHDFRGLAELASEARIPLQAGENWWGPLDFRHAFDAGVRDHVMPDVMKCGGVTGWMQVAAMAQVHGTTVSSHVFPEISAQLLSATPTAGWLEYIDWWNPVLAEPLVVTDGVTDLSGTVGTGVAFDHDAVRRYAA